MQKYNESKYHLKLILPASDSFFAFPLSNAYSVGYILNHISSVKHACDPNHHLIPNSNVVCVECCKLWDGYKIGLSHQLFYAVARGALKLWNAGLDSVVAPPVSDDPWLRQVKWWELSAFIYKDDLKNFCEDQRIYVIFDGENEQNSVYSGNHVVSAKKENNANLNECISPSAANQQAQDSGNGIQDAWAGYVDQTTLNKNVENLKVEAPVSSVKETKEDRVARLKKRKSALKAQGVRDFLKTLAEEEGISVTRIKQLVGEKKQQSKDSISWVSQLATCNSPKKKRNS